MGFDFNAFNANRPGNQFNNYGPNHPSKYAQTQILGAQCGGQSFYNRSTWMNNILGNSPSLFSNSYNNSYYNSVGSNNNYGDYFYSRYNTNSSNNDSQNQLLNFIKSVLSRFNF